MKKILSVIHNISPFNNREEMSTVEYVIKKALAFGLIYCLSAVIGEGVVIGTLYGMGYDPLHGIMPEGLLADLLPYYGFVVFILITVLYCKIIEKRTLQSNGFKRNITDYLQGILLAVLLLFLIVFPGCVTNVIQFKGFHTDVNVINIVLWLFAFVIQGTAEEVMCRGFLMSSLLKKISVLPAVIISSTAFTIPHLSSLFEADFEYAIIGMLNLYLVSAIFSVLVLLRSNIWIACGLHSIWNFLLYGIMGLSVSGSEIKSDSVIRLCVEKSNIFNGGEYGIEASIITTVVLGLFVFVLIKVWKERVPKNGI